MDRPARLRSLLSAVLTDAEPDERLNALTSLRRELDATETELAADALHAGMSWSQIGAALGVSKQAAHRRHSHGVALLDRAAETQHRGSRAIVSSEARRAVRIARAEAAAVGDTQVGTEHLLLGLLQCGDAKTARVLARLGVTVSLARQAAQPTVEVKPHEVGFAAEVQNGQVLGEVASDLSSPSPGRARPSAVVSPLARRVLERALTPAAPGEPGSLSALDLLGALLRHDHGGATRTLAALGVEAQNVQDEIARLDQVSQTPSVARARPDERRPARSRPG
jgi:hypothetical protein